MMQKSQNLLQDIPEELPEELVQTLLVSSHLRIERIISHGHASPEGFWYDQPEAEWVLLVSGAAQLRLGDQCIHLQPGDYLEIPAGVRHRVDWTTPDEPTIWLAVHFDRKA